MSIYPTERTALFIDGANLFSTAKALSFEIDYHRLREHFKKRCRLTRAHYYTVLSETQEYSSIRPLVDWLDYNGYTVITKPMKEYKDQNGRRKCKGNIDIELSVDALQLSDHLDHIILFTGDGDFRCLVEALQQRGKRVSIVSSLASHPPMIADELRRQADEFIELQDLEDDICRLGSSVNKSNWQQSDSEVSCLDESDY
ncbi:MAG: NYN domain-containing protein [Rhodomicrobium sp.]|nr:MAG: NYN domain-containing protein [Rhodomicrobium sp.]